MAGLDYVAAQASVDQAQKFLDYIQGDDDYNFNSTGNELEQLAARAEAAKEQKDAVEAKVRDAIAKGDGIGTQNRALEEADRRWQAAGENWGASFDNCTEAELKVLNHECEAGKPLWQCSFCQAEFVGTDLDPMAVVSGTRLSNPISIWQKVQSDLPGKISPGLGDFFKAQAELEIARQARSEADHELHEALEWSPTADFDRMMENSQPY